MDIAEYGTADIEMNDTLWLDGQVGPSPHRMHRSSHSGSPSAMAGPRIKADIVPFVKGTMSFVEGTDTLSLIMVGSDDR
jgi:hypothetical protein